MDPIPSPPPPVEGEVLATQEPTNGNGIDEAPVAVPVAKVCGHGSLRFRGSDAMGLGLVCTAKIQQLKPK